jgi:hypothetical protein
MRPRMIRKEAETEVPIMPPILEKESNRWDIALAVAATTRVVTTTILAQVS